MESEHVYKINDTIKKNNLSLFKTVVPRKFNEPSQIQGLKNDVSLLSRLYIAHQHMEGDLFTFFSNENQNFPPAFSEDGNIKPPDNKCDLLKRLITTADVCDDSEIFNCTTYDGMH